MKRILVAAVMLIVSAIQSNAAEAPQSFADLVDKLSPAVVNISTTQVVKGYDTSELNTPLFPKGSPFEQFNQALKDQLSKQAQPQSRKATSLGSGFIIDPSGIIITNNHVVAGGTEITVTMHDDTQYKAKIIGRDSKVDVAVLKITAAKPLPSVQFGDSDSMRVGDWILAIGNPYGLGGTVTAGIISARARDINVGPFDDFLQTDAAINRGNSGGPMFNTKGEVVGINTAIFSPDGGGNVGIGFAMPTTLVQPVINQIVKYGKAKRAWLGVKMQTVTKEIGDSLGLKQPDGALVLEVLPQSPAIKAGLREGDVITQFNGHQISSMRKLPKMVAETEIGKQVALQIFRNGQYVSSNVTLTEMVDNEQKADNSTNDNIDKKEADVPHAKLVAGMKLLGITPEVRDSFNITRLTGVLVLAVDQKSGEAGVRKGDIISKAGQKIVSTVADVESAIREAKSQNRVSILLLLENGDESRFVAVPIQ